MVEPDKKRSRGFGFVAYGTAREAHEAIAKANGLPIQGKRLKVELKTPQDQTKGGRKSISNNYYLKATFQNLFYILTANHPSNFASR